MNDAQIQAIAEKVLGATLGAFGFQRAEARSGIDHSDEPAVFVDAILAAGAPPIPGQVSMDARLALSDALLAAGEERFPYLRTRRLGDDDLPEEAAQDLARSHS
jgi:hypothetical protein